MKLRIALGWFLGIELLLACVSIAVAAEGTASPFVRPAGLEPDIAFWRRVYTEVTTNGGLIHDPEELSVVYEAVKFPEDLSPHQRAKKIDEIKDKYAKLLKEVARQPADALSPEAARVKALWPEGTRSSRFLEAADDIRFQLGQADRFREGLVRSGAWMENVAATFERMGLPRELAALPHVESSFNTYAYSKVGAAGMWQFMRGTGRRFLRIDNVVDERLDPYRSTAAAARFLQQNYAVLGSWPLALTAYNHGAAGMRRAVDQLHTTDVEVIVRKYNSRTFGFASRNFYVAFLAALEIDTNPEKFFSGVHRNPVDTSIIFTTPNFMPVSTVTKALNVDRDDLRKLNPSLLPAVWSGVRHIPKGFDLRIPKGLDLSTALAKVPEGEKFDAQIAETHHRVRSGESLAAIASQYGISVARLAELNSLEKPYRIRAGQLLELPERAKGAAAAIVAAAPEAAKPAPPAAAAEVPIPPDRYIVRRGDTLSAIGSRHGLTEEQLMKINGLKDRNYVYEGQPLALRESEAVAATAQPAAPPPAEVVAVAAESPPVPAAKTEEPVSEREAEETGPALLPGNEAADTADPSDYSVAKDQTIRVEAAETIGHYADWLKVRASRLREINRMSRATPVVTGRKLRLDFSRVSPEEFEAKRTAYHKQLQDAFFAQFRISGTDSYVVKPGDSSWVLTTRRFNLPIWLLRQYNPDVDLESVRPGTKLTIPTVEPVTAEGTAQ
jgi:membrane-bound lytic murein transglycosylase D